MRTSCCKVPQPLSALLREGEASERHNTGLFSTSVALEQLQTLGAIAAT
jgi:hypothetical protein